MYMKACIKDVFKTITCSECVGTTKIHQISKILETVHKACVFNNCFDVKLFIKGGNVFIFTNQ